MKFSHSAVLAFLAAATSVSADSCSYVSGNYYCSETDKVIYQGIGYSGSYMDVTNMDETSGECTQESLSFSGNLSPLDEELSVHFRGPLKLLQFGVYYPSSSSSNTKRELAEEDCTTKHIHHKHKRATEIIEVTETVIVNGQGQTVTTSSSTTSTAAAATEAANDDTSVGTTIVTTAQTTSSEDDATSTASSTSSDSSSAASGAWERTAYYTPGSTTNVTFLNYYGGSGSGVWSSTFGDSLSYCNSDASGGSSTAVALDEVTIASDVEYLIMSGDSCDGDCGYYRSGIPAYHGFGGNTKIMIFEFEMPTATDSTTNNHDMPAIWLLNAKIPRTLQYGSASCSCWSTGCGELDLFEVLSAGEDKCISHLHDGQGDNGSSYGGGGSSDYFSRPLTSSMTAAVIFNGDEIHIMEVDADISSTLDASTVESWIAQSGSTASLV